LKDFFINKNLSLFIYYNDQEFSKGCAEFKFIFIKDEKKIKNGEISKEA